MADNTGLETALGNQETVTRHYGGTVEMHFEPVLHGYWVEIDGQRYFVSSVTTVLDVLDKPALVQWAANETVNHILDAVPMEDQAREYMRAYYQRLRDKLPWDEAVNGPSALVTLDTRALVDIANAARFNFRKISKDATDVGKQAHGWLETFINTAISLSTGGEFSTALPEEERARNCVTAALAWFNKHKFRPLASEKKVYSLRYNYSGTFDWLAYITSCGDAACCPFEGEKLCLGDFKSSKALYDEYRLQVAAYQQAHTEEFPDVKIDLRCVLRLGKDDGAFEPMTMTNDAYEADLDGFLGALEAYNWQKQIDLDRKMDRDAEKAFKKAQKAKDKKPRKVAIKKPKYEEIPVEVV